MINLKPTNAKKALVLGFGIALAVAVFATAQFSAAVQKIKTMIPSGGA